MNKKIGIHIRLNNSLTGIIEKAIRLNIPFFQTFLTFQNGKHIKLDTIDVKNFLIFRQKFSNLYLHGSYWINLCAPENASYKVLEKEINMAKKLEFTHLILHPGSATACKNRMEGIDNLTRALNRILKNETQIKILLENIAHGNLSIGGDLSDFQILLTKLDEPEKIAFCIDTAHAYAFGYDIANCDDQDKFISLIDQTIGKEKIELIHLNDTTELLGKKMDKHNIPGQGNIGQKALLRFLQHHHFLEIPILIEFPVLPEEEEIKNYEEIKNWK